MLDAVHGALSIFVVPRMGPSRLRLRVSRLSKQPGHVTLLLDPAIVDKPNSHYLLQSKQYIH